MMLKTPLTTDIGPRLGRIDSPHDQQVRTDALKRCLQIGPEEGAVSFLHDSFVRRAVIEFRQDLAPIRAGNRHMQVLLPHLQECVVQIRREFLPYLGHCRFADCAHVSEPGCAVRSAVASGAIPERRYASFLKLRDELASGG